MGAAGLCDFYWHSRFGLDETSWSFPHAMLGWAVAITLLGFVSCRLALGRYRPLRWYTVVLFAVLLLGTAGDLTGGPIGKNYLPELLGRIASLRVLAHEPSFQHTVRIYLHWN